jgi:type VI secretion system protein
MALRELRLLERIKRMESDPERRYEADPELATRSVLGHLQRILNTRQGSVEIADDFGIPDFTDLATNYSQAAIAEIEEAIREVVMHYEPRLSAVTISAESREEDHATLRFKMDGRIELRDAQIAVSFETTVDGDGRVRIGT